jgi:hypothetical protein
MFTIIFGGILFIFALYYLFSSKSYEEKPKEKYKKSKKEVIKNTKKEEKVKEKKETEKIKIEKKEPENDLSKYLFKTIKECNSMLKCYFYKHGHLILFCDEKKISLLPIKNFFTDTPKTYNKTIEKDVIVDVCLSPEKN